MGARRVRAVLLHALAHRPQPSHLSASAVAFEIGYVGAAVVAAACRAFTSITHLPRSTGEVRSACEVWVRMLPWAEQTLTPSVPDIAPSGNSGPTTFGIRLVRRRAARRTKRIGWPRTDRGPADPSRTMCLEEQLGFVAHRHLELIVEVGIRPDIGADLVEILEDAATAPRKRESEDRRPRRSAQAIRRNLLLGALPAADSFRAFAQPQTAPRSGAVAHRKKRRGRDARSRSSMV